MEEKQIIEGKLGTVGKYDLDYKEGKLCFEIDAAVGPGEAGLVVKLDAGKVLDAIAKAIPGESAVEVLAISGIKTVLGLK